MSATSPIHLLAVTLLLFISNSVLHAANIRFLPWDEQIAERKLAFFNGKDSIELQDLHPQKRSKPVHLAGGEAVPQLIAQDRTSPDGKPVSIPVKIKADMENPLVLILPDPAQPTGVRCYIIEESTGSFGWGTIRFINATGKEMLVRNDKLTKSLPKSWTPVDLDPGGDKRNIGIQMANQADLATVIYSSVWSHDPNVRKLVIILPGVGAEKASVDLKIIPEDRRTVAAPEPETSDQTP